MASAAVVRDEAWSEAPRSHPAVTAVDAPAPPGIELTARGNTTHTHQQQQQQQPQPPPATADADDGSGGEWTGSDFDSELEPDVEQGRPGGAENSKRRLAKRASRAVRRTRHRAGAGCAAIRSALCRLVAGPLRSVRAVASLGSKAIERRWPSAYRSASLAAHRIATQCGPCTGQKCLALWLIQLLVVSAFYWAMQGNPIGMIDGARSHDRLTAPGEETALLLSEPTADVLSAHPSRREHDREMMDDPDREDSTATGPGPATEEEEQEQEAEAEEQEDSDDAEP